jgi:predicted neutral ceramidase superfamily lipid hydrolase
VTVPPPDPARQHTEERSLDFVQRMILSALIVVVMGTLSAGLAAYLVLRPDELPLGSRIMLWVMTGLIGLVTAGVILVVNRRRPYAPWVLLGLLPMAVSAWWIF